MEVGEPLGGPQAVQRQVWDHLALDFISDSPAGVGSVIAELRMNCKAVLFETPLHVVSLLCACGPTDIGQVWPYSPVYLLESGVWSGPGLVLKYYLSKAFIRASPKTQN